MTSILRSFPAHFAQSTSQTQTSFANGEHLLELRGVGKSWGQTVALENLNLQVPQGGRVGIIGRSGAGKSTLVRVLAGLETPERGEFLFSGQVCQTSAARSKAQRDISLVFQHFNLLAQRTALQNVALPLEFRGVSKAEREKKARELLAQVGLSGLEHRYPAQLSGGQKQRVGIARALVTEPKLLLADEATSALDPESSASILRLLGQLSDERGLSLLVVTHQMEVVRAATQQVIVLDGGRVVESGPTAQVLAAPQHPTTRALLFAGNEKTLVGVQENEQLLCLPLGEVGPVQLQILAELNVRLLSLSGSGEATFAAPKHLSAAELAAKLEQGSAA